ncbi:MAG: hypothetical protein ACJ8DI_14780 [Ktedonobacteraceae bacterium]
MHQADRHDQSNGSEQFIALFLTPHCLRQFASVLYRVRARQPAAAWPARDTMNGRVAAGGEKS